MWLAESHPIASAFMGFFPFPALESEDVLFSYIPSTLWVFPLREAHRVLFGENTSHTALLNKYNYHYNSINSINSTKFTSQKIALTVYVCVLSNFATYQTGNFPAAL